MLKFLSSFLYNRHMKVSCNGVLSDCYPLQNDIITGSSLSLLLFIVFLNDNLDVINLPTKRLPFIDDLVISLRGKSLDTLLIRH